MDIIEKKIGNIIPTRSRKLLQAHGSVSSLVQFVLDLLIVNCVLYLLVILRNGVFSEHYQTLAFICSLLMMVIYKSSGLYRHNTQKYTTIMNFSKAWLTVFLILMAYAFITKTTDHFSRIVVSSWFLIGLSAQLLNYFLFQEMTRRYGLRDKTQKKVLIIGDHWIGKELSNRVNYNHWIHEQVIGYVSDNEPEKSEPEKSEPEKNNSVTLDSANEVKYLGRFQNIPDLIKMYGVRRVYLVLPMTEMAQIETLYTQLLDEHMDVNWIPDIFGLNLLNHHIREISGIPVIALSETPLVGERALIKSFFDIIVSLLALFILSPIMLMTALLVKLTSKGSILFKQKRHGMDGGEFEVYKFRSMYTHTPKNGLVQQASKDDVRFTKIGKFIRRTSIDELPQLFNVFNGTMSLIGPRPHAVEHNDYYSKKIDVYMSRHRIKPGITGLAQVNGCRGETETLEKMKKRVDFDLNYINHWSIFLDIKIIIKTVVTLFSKEAY